MRYLSLAFATIVLFACGPHASSVAGDAKTTVVTPCPSVSRSPPIDAECVAAAIAEESFLQQTHHQIGQYLIVSSEHTKARWKFVIEETNGTLPPPDGHHWFVSITKSTGVAELNVGR
jgi:hypothetical protein